MGARALGTMGTGTPRDDSIFYSYLKKGNQPLALAPYLILVSLDTALRTFKVSVHACLRCSFLKK